MSTAMEAYNLGITQATKKLTDGDSPNMSFHVFRLDPTTRLPPGIHVNRDMTWQKSFPPLAIGYHSICSTYGNMNGVEFVEALKKITWTRVARVACRWHKGEMETEVEVYVSDEMLDV